MSPEIDQNANDESAREEPGYGDENLTAGPIVDEQLEALGAFGGNPADTKSKESSIEEAFEAAKADEPSEEEEEKEAESTKADEEKHEEVEELEKTPEPEPKVEAEAKTEEEEEEGEEEEATEDELSDEEISEIEELKAQNAKLMELVNSQLLSQEEEEEEIEPAKEQEPVQKQETPSKRLPLSIPKLPELTQENLDEVISNPESFNKYMKAVFDAGQQSLFSMLPRIVSTQMETRDVMTNFFKENQDLAPLHEFVKQLAMKVQNKDPSATAATALVEAGKQARVVLGLNKGKQREERQGNKKPRRRFAPATSKRSGPTESSKTRGKAKKEDQNSVESQIAEMEKAGGMF